MAARAPAELSGVLDHVHEIQGVSDAVGDQQLRGGWVDRWVGGCVGEWLSRGCNIGLGEGLVWGAGWVGAWVHAPGG